MQGMNKAVFELFAMLKVAESDIQKEHEVLMVNKTTSFKKSNGKKRNYKKGGKQLLLREETQGWTQAGD